MPSNMITVKDPAPVLGMNTVDDPNVLKPGECVRLLNMFPENPPIPRNGCPGVYKSHIDNTDSFQPPINIFFFRGDTVAYSLGWLYNGTTNKYYLVRFRADGSDTIYEYGTAEVTDPLFGMLPLFYNTYCFISKDLTSWNSDTKALSHKVIESANVVRDMCISEAASVTSVTAVTSTGTFPTGSIFDYAFQYVRHTDADYFEAGTTPTGLILPEGVTGKPKRVDTFLPGVCVGVELPANRKNVTVTAPNNTVAIDITNDHSIALAQGATHIRVSRNQSQDTLVLAQGATHYFICDLPLVSGTYNDTTLDAALDGEVNFLLTGYSAAPAGAFAKKHLGRLFIFGDKVYYSEVPGGDGAYSEVVSQSNPQAWASLFKPLTYFLDCDYGDGIQASGVEVLENDIYFFKTSKIFALYGGDPTATAVTMLSDVVGCPFPHTICKIDIQTKGSFIFFVSNRGPALISAGGRIELFSEFKIKELWPSLDRSLYGQIDGFYSTIIKECTAMFFKDTLWVLYRSSTGDKKIFGYYFSSTETDIRGSMEVELAVPDIFGAIVALDNVNLKAYLFGSSANFLVVTEFLKSYAYEDLGTEEQFVATDITEDSSEIVEDPGEIISKEGI